MLKLPSKLHPDKATFEKLGFVFVDYSHPDFYIVELPSGWTSFTDPFGEGHITDIAGNTRVHIQKDPATHVFSMSLQTRYIAEIVDSKE